MKRSLSGFTLCGVATFGLALAGLGCGSDPKKGDNAAMAGEDIDWGNVDRSRCSESGKKVITVDVNKDNKPDIWKFYATQMQDGQEVQVVTCKQVDLNQDGNVDLIDHYGADGNVEMTEFDLDFDGKFDQKDYRMGGKLVRQERDMAWDDRPDMITYHEGGAVARIERDSDGDGRIDEWQFFEDGKLDRVGYDTTGSGKADKWDRANAEPEPEMVEGSEEAADAAEEAGDEAGDESTDPPPAQ